MKYDYTFFEKHAAKSRLMRCPAEFYVSNALIDLYGTEREAGKHYEVVISEDETDNHFTVIRYNGAYCKGGESVKMLENILRSDLPDDFKQFYEQFGEAVIVTRSEPIWICPLQTMIDDFEDDPDIDVLDGRFFRFARYQDPLFLGLRRSDLTDEWQVVVCTYGLLYSEMIGPQGRGNVVAPSFYEWLKHLIDTDGYPDNIYPRDQDFQYLSVIEEHGK